MKRKGDRIAIIGDIHGRWNELDNAYFDAAPYDLLVFVGDLGSGTLQNGLSIIRHLARLRVPALVLPGNNDALHLAELKAELAHQSGKLEIFRMFGDTGPSGVRPCGFSLHELTTSNGPVSLIAARPCAMGGSDFSFAEQIGRNHAVHSLEESTARLKQLVNESSAKDLLFVAHNGPFGLGDAPTDPWGRDFPLAGNAAGPRDWGDRDLREAIDYACSSGKRVLAVIAGHMHRRTSGDTRPFLVKRDGVSYVNVALVPRIFSGSAGAQHHHVELRLHSRYGVGLELFEHRVTLPLDASH